MDNLGMYARPSDLTGCISACKPTSLGMGTRCPHQTSPLHSKNSMGCAEDVPRKEYTERSLEIPRRTFSLSATVLLCSGTLGYGNVPCARELITDVSPVRGAPCHGAPWKPPVGPSAPASRQSSSNKQADRGADVLRAGRATSKYGSL